MSDPIQAVACSSTQDNHSSNSAPISELRLDPYRVLPFEEEANAEYFRGKSGQKTPERYLRIRNHIIGLWLKQQPRYLNKTSSRMGLKNCGDVNCIGLIHDYLERIGAINFGCPQTNAKKDRTAPDSTSLKKVSLIFSSTRSCRRINRIDIVKSMTNLLDLYYQIIVCIFTSLADLRLKAIFGHEVISKRMRANIGHHLLFRSPDREERLILTSLL